MPDTVQYVYATIPAQYACLYHKLLVLLSDYGVDMLNDCSATCKGSNKNIVTCFNMFEAGVASYNLGLTSRANAIMTYINAEVNAIYRARGRECPKGEFKMFADEEGSTIAYATCNGDSVSFRVEDAPSTTSVTLVNTEDIENIQLTSEDLNE